MTIDQLDVFSNSLLQTVEKLNIRRATPEVVANQPRFWAEGAAIDLLLALVRATHEVRCHTAEKEIQRATPISAI